MICSILEKIICTLDELTGNALAVSFAENEGAMGGARNTEY